MSFLAVPATLYDSKRRRRSSIPFLVYASSFPGISRYAHLTCKENVKNHVNPTARTAPTKTAGAAQSGPHAPKPEPEPEPEGRLSMSTPITPGGAPGNPQQDQTATLAPLKTAGQALVSAANALHAHADPATLAHANTIVEDFHKQAHNALLKK